MEREAVPVNMNLNGPLLTDVAWHVSRKYTVSYAVRASVRGPRKAYFMGRQTVSTLSIEPCYPK